VARTDLNEALASCASSARPTAELFDASSRKQEEAPRSRRRVAPVALACLGLAVAFGVVRLARSFAASRAPPAMPPTAATPSAPQPLSSLSAAGWLVATREVVVSARVAGRVVEMRVAEGDRVAASAVLARLDSSAQRAQLGRAVAALAKARAVAAEAQRSAGRAETLAGKNILSAADLDAAESRLASAEADVEVAEAERAAAGAALEATIIRAPFAATVVRRLAEVGQAVSPAAVPRGASEVPGAVATLADLSALEAEADVNETHLSRVSVGQPVEIEVAASPGRRFPGKVLRIDRVADRAKGAVTVRVRLTERDPVLRPHLSAKIAFLDPPSRETGPENLEVKR
jgi:RND family efflux transporter MFP subunit